VLGAGWAWAGFVEQRCAGPGAERDRERGGGGGIDQGMAGFCQFGTFRELFFSVGPAISGVQNGFSRFEMLFENFDDLGRNLYGKLLISRKIRGIGARKFVAM
jgi:hypothetical protein